MNEGINVSEMSGGGAMMVLLGTESHAISSLRLNLEHNLSSIFLVEKSLIHHVGSPFSLIHTALISTAKLREREMLP